MNYEDALAFIHGTLLFGTKLGLKNIKTLLSHLGNPQDKLSFIHVAGTNGKGSVCAMTAEVLMQAGYRVGVYTSPFIHRFNERICINHQNISDDELSQLTALVKQACDLMVREGLAHPTEFEIVTAIGFLHFAKQHCDFVLLEVGLGGRLDATNVISHPLVAVICAIGFDHMQYLGTTLGQIADEKCGIIKEGTQVVSYPLQPPEALSVIRAAANETHSALAVAQVPENVVVSAAGGEFSYKTYQNLKISLLGEHQIYNAATALEVVFALRSQGISVPDSAIYQGLLAAKWPARFEKISGDPLFYIDGAHNAAGMAAFLSGVKAYFGEKKKIFIMGILEDKEYEACCAMAAPLADIFIATNVPSARSLPAGRLAEIAAGHCADVQTAETPKEAAALAKSLADQSSVICAFGSLYMMGEFS